MNTVDTIILVLVIGSGIAGLFWGLIRQIASIFGMVLAIMAAGKYYDALSAVLHHPDGSGIIGDPGMAKIVAFAAITIGVSLGIGIIASILRLVLGLLFLGWLDHLLGAIFGVLTSLLLIEVVLLAATFFPVPNVSDAVKSSQLAQAILPSFSFVINWLPPEFNILRFMVGA